METHDVEELREVLNVVADKVPALLRGLRDVLYSKESAENMAESVGTFYKKLVESGIPKEDALEMARGYMINLRDIMGNKGINIGDFTHHHRDDDEQEDEN
ncbi:MAG TPA: hypothetical protein ENH11_01555 [Candidatus Acetothermia bacterium]|nr:hypothetical protein [Candidatus Acetothermia bacterium]